MCGCVRLTECAVRCACAVAGRKLTQLAALLKVDKGDYEDEETKGMEWGKVGGSIVVCCVMRASVSRVCTRTRENTHSHQQHVCVSVSSMHACLLLCMYGCMCVCI